MKHILIVDDEKPFLLSLKDGLAAYAKDLNVLTALNGKEAVKVLESTKVDLVVTDLKMPVMDGFQLMAYMSRSYPGIPIIVMTAFGTQEIEEQLKELDTFNYLEKPLEFGVLAEAISQALAAGPRSYLRGISLPNFLQLVRMDRKTCTLRIKSKGRVGYLYIDKGELLDAKTAKLGGDEAAFEIIGWDETEIEMAAVCKKKKQNIGGSLEYILINALRLKDEKQSAAKERGETTDAGEEGDVKEPEPIDSGKAEQLGEVQRLTKEEQMALETYLADLKEVKGYKAAGIMNFTGEMLANDSSDKNIDLSLVGATFNDIFRGAHAACTKIGLEACKETTIETPKGIVVMCCSGVQSKAHVHLIGVLAADGNHALLRMKMGKMIPAIMDEVA